MWAQLHGGPGPSAGLGPSGRDPGRETDLAVCHSAGGLRNGVGIEGKVRCRRLPEDCADHPGHGQRGLHPPPLESELANPRAPGWKKRHGSLLSGSSGSIIECVDSLQLFLQILLVPSSLGPIKMRWRFWVRRDAGGWERMPRWGWGGQPVTFTPALIPTFSALVTVRGPALARPS